MVLTGSQTPQGLILNKGINYLTIEALNVGPLPPNTASVRILSANKNRRGVTSGQARQQWSLNQNTYSKMKITVNPP